MSPRALWNDEAPQVLSRYKSLLELKNIAGLEPWLTANSTLLIELYPRVFLRPLTRR